MGGLGNQLFQYALGRSLEQNDSVQFSTKHFENDPARFYMLDQAGLDLPLVNRSDTPTIREGNMRFNPSILDTKNASLLGYWQCEKYFLRVKDRIKKELFSDPFGAHPGTAKLFFEIKKRASPAFLHIRRSDTLSKRSIIFHGLIGLDYYNAAANYIRERVPGVHFYVFSDDPEWAHANMTSEDMTVVDCNPMSGEVQPDFEVRKSTGGREAEDLFLMSLCRHGVISNSSFSWWGAWLGEQPDSVVVRPAKWFLTDQVDSTDICPDRWSAL
jgi:hypothetical protein